MGQAIFTEFTNTYCDLTEVEVAELVVIAGSGRVKITLVLTWQDT